MKNIIVFDSPKKTALKRLRFNEDREEWRMALSLLQLMRREKIQVPKDDRWSSNLAISLGSRMGDLRMVVFRKIITN